MYSNTAVGLNFLIAGYIYAQGKGYIYAQGKMAFDPELRIAHEDFTKIPGQ